MNKTAFSLGSLLLGLAPLASAQESSLSYSYITASYSFFQFDDAGIDDSVDLNGFSLDLSYEVANRIFLWGGVSIGSGDVDFLGENIDVDYTEFAGGLGAYVPIQPNIDIFGRIGILSGEVDASFEGIEESEDDTGLTGSVGLRILITPQLEGVLQAGVAVLDDTVFTPSAGLLYYVTPQLQIGIGAGFSDEVNTYSVGGRYHF